MENKEQVIMPKSDWMAILNLVRAITDTSDELVSGDVPKRLDDVVVSLFPTISVGKMGKATTITITDKYGTKTAVIYDGKNADEFTPEQLEALKGKDGKDGTDGKDGKDGYTPVKGVDYFDGVDGKNGTDGKDGVDGKNGTDGKDGEDGIDGINGQRGTGILFSTSGIASYTTSVNGITPTYRISLSTLKTQAKVDEVLIGDIVYYSYYTYPVITLDADYAYLGTRKSIRGATGSKGDKGDTYTLTDTDKTNIATLVKGMFTTEEWEFTLEDDTTVTKNVVIG